MDGNKLGRFRKDLGVERGVVLEKSREEEMERWDEAKRWREA
jgi:hypothetical protein